MHCTVLITSIKGIGIDFKAKINIERVDYSSAHWIGHEHICKSWHFVASVLSQEEFLKNERVGWNVSIDSFWRLIWVNMTLRLQFPKFRRLAFVKIHDGRQQIELVWKWSLNVVTTDVIRFLSLQRFRKIVWPI